LLDSGARADVNAAGSTFGILFIAVPVYIIFPLFPFWAAIPVSGAWWPFWKSLLLHHPPPEVLLSDPLSHAGWGFLAGVKRMVLPMIILITVLKLLEKRKRK